jgi:serine/threonine protein kinase
LTHGLFFSYSALDFSQSFQCLGFTIDGTMKLLDFGLARILENADCKSNEVYSMSGETGSLRYMAPGTSTL